MRIEPPVGRANVRLSLSETIERSIALRGAIAYWTVAPDYVSGQLPRLLSLDGSFLCVDIHSPTDTGQLDLLAAAGGQVFIHLRQLL
jgi:hypothetical protein